LISNAIFTFQLFYTAQRKGSSKRLKIARKYLGFFVFVLIATFFKRSRNMSHFWENLSLILMSMCRWVVAKGIRKGVGVTTLPLELHILQKLYYLCKGN